MATFEAKVYKLKIEEHPNADALELAVVGDYRSIVRKGQFKTGDLGVYIPEAAVLPEWLIEELGLVGRLAGKRSNRVKAVKLRNILSQGLIYPVTELSDGKPGVKFRNDVGESLVISVFEGMRVDDVLNITKYEPPIPVHLAGEVWNAHGKTINYDIENFKKYPNVFTEGEPVFFTEKIHGTWSCIGYHPDVEIPIITSKGLSGQGLAFKMNGVNEKNTYVRTLYETPYLDRAKMYVEQKYGNVPFYILGEIFGKGIQDLTYGTNEPTFRAFDVYVGQPGTGRYLGYTDFVQFCQYVGVDRVPVVYTGSFSKEIMEEMTSGKEVISGKEANIREGIVIKPIVERYDVELGRVVLKSISEQYLLRKDGTEFN